jgi:putative hydrolase of the HAD superfamily
VVLFDLGNTLLYFDANPVEVYPQMDQRLLRELLDLGYRLDSESFLQDFVRMAKDADDLGEETWIEIPTAEIVRTLLANFGYSDVPESDLRQALAGFYSVSQQHWMLEGDAIPVIKELKQTGYRLGIISNASDTADVLWLLANRGLGGFFEQVWISSEIGLCKPHPEIFQRAIEYFQTPASQIAFVGDTLTADILGSATAGMQSIWISRRAARPENHMQKNFIQPAYQIASLAELPFVLKTVPS